MLWHRAKQRAKKLCLPFDLEVSDITIPDYCPVLGLKLRLNKGGRSGYFPDSPSLDRFKPELGYTKENVFVISSRANRIKGDSSIEELEKVLAYVRGVRHGN